MPIDEQHMSDTAYGPNGIVVAGVQFDERDRKMLAESYRDLDNALTVLQGDGHEGMTCYLHLLSPYLGDPADPSIVTGWRRSRPGVARWHDLAIDKLAGYLRHKDLHVVWPRRMTGQQERQIERRNDELFTLYRQFRAEGQNKTNSVKNACVITGYSESTGWRIVRTRESAA